VRQFSFCYRSREFREQINASAPQRLLAERGECNCSVLTEIAAWHFGVAISFASEESSYISAIFAKQRPRIIFQMALHEKE
jgi:hypothetical protein